MKSKRQALILEIISAQDVETQEELANRLRAHGIDVTQATVSRDIKELRLIKVPAADGNYKYASPEKEETAPADRYMRILSETILSTDCAGNIIVIKTMTASAQTVAEIVDNLKWEEIIGTIAGDNTVLVIVKNPEDTQDVIDRFQSITGRK